MWASWLIPVFGGLALLFLIVALVATAWAPVVAVIVSGLVAAALVFVMSSLRARSERRTSAQRAGTEAATDPASGEGEIDEGRG